MPAVYRCPNCFLAVNTGFQHFGEYGYCVDCGTISYLEFRMIDGILIITDLQFDKDGPRIVDHEPNLSGDQHPDQLVDLTFCGPIAPRMSMVATPNHPQRFSDFIEMESEIFCGKCNGNIRFSAADQICPKCREHLLEYAGGWMI